MEQGRPGRTALVRWVSCKMEVEEETAGWDVPPVAGFFGGGEVLDGLSKPASTATKQVGALVWLFRAQNSAEKLCA